MKSPPQINITFPDKSEDSLELIHEKASYSSPLRCTYTGHLRQNPSSIGSVTGCFNKPGDKIDITLFSGKSEDNMFTVDYYGKTTALKKPFGKEGILIRFSYIVITIYYNGPILNKN